LQDFNAKKEQILDDLETLRGMLLHSAGAVVDCTAGKNGIDAVFSGGMKLLSSLPAGTGGSGLQNTALLPSCPAEVFATPSQVNYVGKGCNLYALGWKFSGAAQVILRYLRMGYLWDSVRVKGGAYGVSCRLGRSTGNFVCTSYRDPNVSGTISAYDGIADYLSGMSLNREELERAIVGAIGDLDLYMLPDARGVKSLYQYLAGDTEEKRQRMREEMLSTTADDFRAFAGIMAEAKTHGAVSVIGGSRALEEGTRLGWKCENLF
ncbi:MAG: peptidase M16, partial [Desulfovibrio sp.]